jgi:hypothetical protein
VLAVFVAVSPPVAGHAAERLSFWVKSLLVAPAHGPSVVVAIRNESTESFEGQISLAPPAGWVVDPDRQAATIAAGGSCEVRFLVKTGVNLGENAYPMVVTARDARSECVHRQAISVASAPYFKPAIDGKFEDWADSIPVSWVTAGKKTTVSTYWNRRQFSMLVAVEEDQLSRPAGDGRPCDAVQIAIAAGDTQTGVDASGEATRFEFLVAPAAADGPGQCFRLAEPGTKLSETQTDRPLKPMSSEESQVVVRRDAGVTYYECSWNWGAMREAISPGEGREFCCSVLVHDPDGTGLRDWGLGAGFGASRRNRLAWSRWPGAKWPAQDPFDNKTPWGMCSSKF